MHIEAVVPKRNGIPWMVLVEAASSDPMDTNGDGTVSAEERMAYAYQQLMEVLNRLSEALDKNHSTTSVTS